MNLTSLKEFLETNQIPAKDMSLFTQAFTHSSYKNETTNPFQLDYERLETLGDSVLSLIVIDISYRYRPSFEPRDLTVMKIDFVQANSLISYGLKIGLHQLIRLGRGMTITDNPKIIEDVFEALIGAIYLDCGFRAAYGWILKIMGEDIKNFTPDRSANRDYKSELQIAFQAEQKSDLSYRLITKTGKDNDPTFVVGVYFMDSLLGKGSGKSKKAAEQEAAKEALERMAS